MSNNLRTAGYLQSVAEPGERPVAGRTRLVAIWTMLVLSVVSWRTGVYYAGGLDPVVVAKAALDLVALGLAVLAAADCPRRAPVGVRTIVLVGSYLVVTVLGGWATGSLLASGVLALRVMIIAAVIVLIVLAYPIAEVVLGLCLAMVLVGGVCAITGVGSVLSGGRLVGGVLPINANDIAMLFGAPTIALVWRLLRGSGGRFDAVALVVFLGLTWLTGSRTGLLALMVAIVVMVMQTRPLPIGAFVASVASVPVMVYLVVSTGLVATYFERGGSGNVATLSSRTIAWQGAFSAPTGFWQHWFGGGLAIKMVGVTGTYWDTQVLDSSWVSAFVQAGVIGFCLLAVWAVSALVASFRTAPSWRALWTGVVIYSIIRSLLSSGLIDAYVLFVVMFLASLATERVTRQASPRLPAAPGRGYFRDPER